MAKPIREDNLWYKGDGDKVNDLWEQVEIDHLTWSERHYKPLELVDNHLGHESNKGKGI